LASHEKFLCKFIEKFRAVDSDNNGTINEEEFKNLVENMGVPRVEGDI